METATEDWSNDPENSASITTVFTFCSNKCSLGEQKPYWTQTHHFCYSESDFSLRDIHETVMSEAQYSIRWRTGFLGSNSRPRPTMQYVYRRMTWQKETHTCNLNASLYASLLRIKRSLFQCLMRRDESALKTTWAHSLSSCPLLVL